jgi:hypothetical protein
MLRNYPVASELVLSSIEIVIKKINECRENLISFICVVTQNNFDLKTIRLESTQRKFVSVGNIRFTGSHLSHYRHSDFIV